MQNLLLRMVRVFICLMILPVPASAHHMWLNATRYTLEEAGQGSFGGKTIIYFGWGDFYPLHDFIDASTLRSFYLVDPKGQRKELTPGEAGFIATKVELPQKGTYLVAAERKPSFVADILEDGKLKGLRKPKDELPKGVQLLESKYSVQSAKALINVGEIDLGDNRASTPIGQDLEIVPLKNPYHLKEGDHLPFKVLFKGSPLRRPLADPTIKATYVGFSTEKDVFAYTTELDTQGIARIKIVRYGIWQIFVVHPTEPPGELAGKVDKIEYKTSLTFEVR